MKRRWVTWLVGAVIATTSHADSEATMLHCVQSLTPETYEDQHLPRLLECTADVRTDCESTPDPLQCLTNQHQAFNAPWDDLRGSLPDEVTGLQIDGYDYDAYLFSLDAGRKSFRNSCALVPIDFPDAKTPELDEATCLLFFNAKYYLDLRKIAAIAAPLETE